jgi:hypothetical protein
MDDRQNLSQPESVITTTEKSPSRNLQKKTCTAGQRALGCDGFQRDADQPRAKQRRIANAKLVGEISPAI